MPSQREIELVKDCFDNLRPYLEPTSLHFYEVLFELAPDLRPLFREDLRGQGMRFMNTLGLILDNMEDPDSTAVDYAELGHVHTTLGVRQSHFAPMEEALVRTLKEKAKDPLTPELEAAWRNAFQSFSRRLIGEGRIPA